MKPNYLFVFLLISSIVSCSKDETNYYNRDSFGEEIEQAIEEDMEQEVTEAVTEELEDGYSETEEILDFDYFQSKELLVSFPIPENFEVLTRTQISNMKEEALKDFQSDGYVSNLLDAAIRNPKSMVLADQDDYSNNIVVQGIAKIRLDEHALSIMAESITSAPSEIEVVESATLLEKRLVKEGRYIFTLLKSKMVFKNREDPLFLTVVCADFNKEFLYLINFNTDAIEPQVFVNKVK